MHRPDTGPSRVRSASSEHGGFTLVELMVSFSALLVVLLGFSRMLLSSRMASSTTHEATLAKEAARSMMEVLEATPFSEIYATYNSDAADDPAAPAAEFKAGKGFRVRGPRRYDVNDASNDALEPPAGLERCGQILFPELNGELSESVGLPQYGWTNLDLNGDGDHDDANVSADYKFLPVLVRVSWMSAGGPASVEFKTVISNF